MGLNEQGGRAAGKSSSTPFVSASLPSTGLPFPDMETFDLSTYKATVFPTPRVEPGNFSRVNGKVYETSLQSMARRGLLAQIAYHPLTSSAADSPVSPSASLASDSPKPMSAGSGPSSHESFAHYDPASSSWRTSQGSLWEAGWTPYSQAWPTSGMTRNGKAFQRQPLVPRTFAGASGSWPTPTARDHKDSSGAALWGQKGHLRLDRLPIAVRAAPGMLPTPQANDWKHPGLPRRGTKSNSGHGLAARVMWPTPQAGDNRDRGNLSLPSIRRRARLGKQLMLSMVVSLENGALNPTWVEWLMGFPLGWTDLGPSETRSSRRSSK